MDKAEIRMSIYNDHVKHAKTWNFKPVDWHTWKFYVWPKLSADMMISAASMATKIVNKKGERI